VSKSVRTMPIASLRRGKPPSRDWYNRDRALRVAGWLSDAKTRPRRAWQSTKLGHAVDFGGRDTPPRHERPRQGRVYSSLRPGQGVREADPGRAKISTPGTSARDQTLGPVGKARKMVWHSRRMQQAVGENMARSTVRAHRFASIARTPPRRIRAGIASDRAYEPARIGGQDALSPVIRDRSRGLKADDAS